jgi:hypothetical protein
MKSKDPQVLKWKTELSVTLSIFQWKPWDGGGKNEAPLLQPPSPEMPRVH